MKFPNPLQLKKKKKIKGRQKETQCDTVALTSLRNKRFYKTKQNTYLLPQRQRQLEITQKTPSAQSLFCFPGLNGQEVPSPLVAYTHALK